MKILLVAINAKYIHSNLAVYSLKAYCGRYAEHVDIAEYTINQQMEEILQDIYQRKPDILAFSCYIWNIDYVKKLVVECAKVLPDTAIWAGGPEVSYAAKEFLQQYPMVELVMSGEGEETFLELVKQSVLGEVILEKIAGITYQTQSEIFENPMRTLMDLSQVPFVYEDLLPFQNKIIYYESSRGCPFSCSYCLSSIDKKLRFRDISLVEQELSYFLKQKVKQVKFVDRTFNCNHEHAYRIWKFIHEHDNGITNFHFEISADLLQEKEIALIRQMRPNLIQLEIGVQSTNKKTLREIDRTMDFEKLSRVVKEIQKGENVHQHLDLIAGLPYEDLESFKQSFQDVYQLKPQQLQLGFLKVLSGSKMHRMAEQYGMAYRENSYEILYTKWLKFSEVILLKGIEEMVEIYYNSGQFTNTINYMERFFDTPFELYERLSEYYKNHSEPGKKHARIDRYTMLLEFIQQQKNLFEEEGVFRNLLVLDLYLRENMKSRPEFAPSQDSFKQRRAEFYRKEETEPSYLKHYETYHYRQLCKMTHIERFDYDMELLRKNGEKRRQETFLLFDYKERNPLSYEAKTYVLSL